MRRFLCEASTTEVEAREKARDVSVEARIDSFRSQVVEVLKAERRKARGHQF
jgi:hypothetical protein